MIMKSGLRKVALIAHVTSSIGWFGAVAGFLALALAGLFSQDAMTVRVAYIAMELITRFVIVPFAFVALLTGIVSSLFTKWGLFRYYWVLVKLVITILATLILLVHTQPIELLAGIAVKTVVVGANLHSEQILLVNASSAALLVLLVVTALSYYKPRGMTQYGWRKQHEERQGVTAVDASNDQAQEGEHEREGNGVHAATLK